MIKVPIWGHSKQSQHFIELMLEVRAKSYDYLKVYDKKYEIYGDSRQTSRRFDKMHLVCEREREAHKILRFVNRGPKSPKDTQRPERIVLKVQGLLGAKYVIMFL